MSRYFVEVAYMGTRYSGFQVQANADTIQSQVEKALSIFYSVQFVLTGASRTDTGVHAMQNFFHFDAAENFKLDRNNIYSLNAILPEDIVLKNIFAVSESAHCRFDAKERSYEYSMYKFKDPFLKEVAFFYPYSLDFSILNTCAEALMEFNDFTSFSKKSTQVKSFNCIIQSSYWKIEENKLIYKVTANRFLRGMVRGLVGTMLRVGTGKISIIEFIKIIESKDCSKADFSVPAHGLNLKNILYPYLFK